MTRTTIMAVCVAAAATLTLSACADDGGSGGASADGPITLMVIQSLTGPAGVDQTIPKSAEAAAMAINDAGGIGGRDIEIVTCDTQSNPNTSAECGRKAISDGVAAVVGSFDPLGSTALIPVLEAGNVPYVGALGVSSADYNSPVAFPLHPGVAAGAHAIAQLAEAHGCTNLGVIADVELMDASQVDYVGAAESLGVTAYNTDMPTNSADVTPFVAQLLDEDPDCVTNAGAAQTAVQVLTGVRKAGSAAQFVMATGTAIAPLLPAMGEAAEGMQAHSENLTLDAPELQPFRDDMEKYQPDVVPSNFTLFGWYGVRAFAAAAEGLDEVTPATVLASLDGLDDLELPGLPTIDFTAVRDSEQFPRMFNTSFRWVTVENGVYVPMDDEWHDVGAELP